MLTLCQGMVSRILSSWPSTSRLKKSIAVRPTASRTEYNGKHWMVTDSGSMPGIPGFCNVLAAPSMWLWPGSTLLGWKVTWKNKNIVICTHREISRQCITCVGNGSRLRQMGSVHDLRLRDKSFLKASGFASIRIPPQLNFLSKSMVFDIASPVRAPHSTKNPFVYHCQCQPLQVTKNFSIHKTFRTWFFKSLNMTPVCPGDRSLSSSESSCSGTSGGDGLFK